MQTYERIYIRRRNKELTDIEFNSKKGNSETISLFMNKFKFNWKRNILFTFLLIFLSSKLDANLPTTIIKSCYDGDTCTTIDGEKIRLACIDTPELKGKKADLIPAKEARDFLNDLLDNEKVSIRRITKDRYGRTVAELIKENTNIQQLLVQKNLAKVYNKYKNQCSWSK